MNGSGTVSISQSRLRGVTAILAAVLAAALFVAPHVVPFAVLLTFVAGVPLAIERIRMGLRSALVATVLAMALAGAVLTPSHGLVFVLFQAAPALLIGESVARGRGLRTGVMLAFWLLFAQIALVLVAVGNSAVTASLKEAFAKMAAPEALAQSGFPPENVAAWTEQMQAVSRIALVIYPAAAIVFACLVVLAQAAVVRYFVARHQPALLGADSFEAMRLPIAAVGLFLLSAPALFWEPLRPFAYNALAILGFFFALQGFAIALYYVRRMAGPPLLRALLLLLILIPAWSPYVLACLGFFDTWLDVRRFADPKPEA